MNNGLKVLGFDLTEGQYTALNELAQSIPDWNNRSEEYKVGVIMGIKARVN